MLSQSVRANIGRAAAEHGPAGPRAQHAAAPPAAHAGALPERRPRDGAVGLRVAGGQGRVAPRGPRAALVRGVRVSKIGKISKLLQFFGGLVLDCIKTKFCKKICV